MAKELKPEVIFKAVNKRALAPYYLFYGPDEFRMEKILDRIKDELIPESVRDFNLEICYGGETDPADIVARAQTLPFMASQRLLIVRRTEDFKTERLEIFLPYLGDPSPSTCLLFLSSKTNFNLRFYKMIRNAGRAVNFSELHDNQITSWIKRAADELGLKMDGQAAAYLQQIVGNNLRALYGELEKLKLRYGNESPGVAEIRDMAVHSRTYSIFELMNSISRKDCGESLTMLKRFLEEEDRVGGPLRFLGMLNRQIRIMWQTKSILSCGGNSKDVAGRLKLAPFSAERFIEQAQNWSEDELAKGLSLLYSTDHFIKSGSRSKSVLENLILTLCC
ncbi:MAG: DNA polymerase III subunit delta [Deltaproteobacteria bacterium]|nr:DNA polymerase III subunit delta [Deltaproteobacteria bacterium]